MERRLAKTNSAQNLRAIHSLDRLIHRVVFFQFNADLHDCWLIHSDVSGQPKKNRYHGWYASFMISNSTSLGRKVETLFLERNLLPWAMICPPCYVIKEHKLWTLKNVMCVCVFPKKWRQYLKVFFLGNGVLVFWIKLVQFVHVTLRKSH